eukprot:m.258121 g.258121  ORF g.258121 m.258121 type:complete len:431 (-) comp36154_c0_seq1:39-1331(-)
MMNPMNNPIAPAPVFATVHPQHVLHNLQHQKSSLQQKLGSCSEPKLQQELADNLAAVTQAIIDISTIDVRSQAVPTTGFDLHPQTHGNVTDEIQIIDSVMGDDDIISENNESEEGRSKRYNHYDSEHTFWEHEEPTVVWVQCVREMSKVCLCDYIVGSKKATPLWEKVLRIVHGFNISGFHASLTSFKKAIRTRLVEYRKEVDENQTGSTHIVVRGHKMTVSELGSLREYCDNEDQTNNDHAAGKEASEELLDQRQQARDTLEKLIEKQYGQGTKRKDATDVLEASKKYKPDGQHVHDDMDGKKPQRSSVGFDTINQDDPLFNQILTHSKESEETQKAILAALTSPRLSSTAPPQLKPRLNYFTNMTESEVLEFVRGVDDRLVEPFRTEGIDGDLLVTITHSDLGSIGINGILSRKLLRAISAKLPSTSE